jgi:hypothetical protein
MDRFRAGLLSDYLEKGRSEDRVPSTREGVAGRFIKAGLMQLDRANKQF